MPGKVGVKIKAGRNLPVMDRGSDTTDAYVEIKLGSVTHKTDVCRKSLNPQWNTDWYRFEVDDAELQDEPLQIRLMDYDTYSANDAIGKVNISLNPLCLENAGHLGQGKGAVMSGWIPVFDTMHGIRGEVNIIVKVDLFSDANKFRQSSCGVQFFHSSCIPHGYRAQVIHGFVEELVVNDDPEYQWIDKIRTPRASNEARQVVFLKLSGQVQRKIGLKAINLGANAVIGYTQCFDLEGDVGVVARGIGTAVTLVKIQEPFSQLTLDTALIEERTLRYLEFLKGNSSGSGDESCKSKFDYDHFQNSCRNRVYTILGIDPVEATTAKSPNVILKKKWHPARESNTIIEESFSESEGIKQLLHQEDMRGEKPQKFRRHVKKLTKSSRNMLNERFRTFKLRMNEERGFDNVSINSSYSDISFTEPLRSSFTDLRGLMRLRKSKMNRSISDGNGMAAVLVNSIIHGPGLDLISEARDSERSTPNRSIKSNKSMKSESMGNLSRANTEKQVIASRVSSDASTSTVTISSSTTEEAFSDDEDDEATTTSCAGATEPDTISMVVKTVLAREHNQDVNWIEPGSTQEDENPIESNVEVRVLLPKQLSTEIGSDVGGKILTGATRIVKRGKYSKVTECEIIETEPTRQNLENILKSADSDEDSINWIEPGSTTDEPETIDKERRGSILQDVVENLSGRFHQLQEHIHLPHFADEHNNQSKQDSQSILNTPDNLKLNTKTSSIQRLNKNKKKNHGNLSALSKKLLSPFNTKFKKNGAHLAKVENIVEEELKDRPDEKWFKGKGHMEAMKNNPFSQGTFTIPEISLTNMQLQTTFLDAGDDIFYSSAPECHESRETIPPSPPRKSFLSLTNLKINDADKSNNTPSSPSCGSDFTPDPVDFVQSQQQLRKQSSKSPKSLDSARNNFLSSSYTNLSTNKAPTLAPFPHLKHFRSELGTNSVSAGVCITAAVAANKAVGHTRAESMGCKISQSPAKVGNSAPICSIGTKDKDKDSGICRRSSDSDLSVTPKGNSICVASDRLVNATNMMRLTANLKPPNQENLDMMEYPFLTMAKYPPGFILHIGATVTARSVKLLERVPNPDEPETRDSWWTELRMEIRSHARSLGCNVILGYSEVTTISDDVCVLSATGTAAIINMSYNGEASQIELTTSSKKDLMVSSLDEKEGLGDAKPCPKDQADSSLSTKEYSTSLGGTGKGSFPPITFPLNLSCSLCHIPYTKSSVPFNIKMKKCGLCKRGKVPDVLLATIEIPECLQISGRGCFLQAQVVRTKKDLRSESNAKEISDGLPFMEYELHRLLINKLKAKGMNAIFGLKAQVAVGEKMMALIATGTAVFLTALPPPIVPKIVAGNSWTDTEKLNNLQKSLQETFERNREIYQLKPLEIETQTGKQSDTDDSDDEVGELDLTTGNKETCVLEIDDIEDLEIISLLMESCPPEGFHVVNTQSVPGLEDMEVVKNLQMFTQVWRAKISVGQTLGQFPKHFQRLLQTIFFKLRSMIPCAICDLKFRLDLPESDEIQLLVTGMALGLGELSKLSKLRRKQLQNNLTDGVFTLNNHSETNGKKPQEEELMFSLDEDQINVENSLNQTPPNNTNFGSHSFKLRKNSPQRTKFSSVKLSRHTPLKDRYGVDITPLSYVPGGKIEKYLGNLNFFFIRESTSIRENGGISGFVHSFITELLAVVRAHISALGGNAMVSFYMTELILVDNQHKNQGQCLISIGGDVVYVSYFTDD